MIKAISVGGCYMIFERKDVCAKKRLRVEHPSVCHFYLGACLEGLCIRKTHIVVLCALQEKVFNACTM